MEVKCSVSLNGLEEKLIELGPKLARKALRKAVGKVGDMWVAEAKSRVPVASGALRESIDKKVTTSRAGTATVAVGPTYNTRVERQDGDGSQQPGVYGMFEEFGTRHAKATPWLRPTFDATADKAVEIFADSLKDDLEDVVGT